MQCYTKNGNNGAIAYIELNRPEALNSINLQMVRKIYTKLDLWEQDSNIKAVVIYSANPKFFCAGGDLQEIYANRKLSLKQRVEFFKCEYNLNLKIKNYVKPYVALVNGIVMGGGMGISAHASHIVVAENLRMAMPEAAIGLFPDSGGGYFLSRVPHNYGLYLGLTALAIGHKTALQWGLATHSVSFERFIDIREGLLDLDLNTNADELIANYLQQFVCALPDNKYDFCLDYLTPEIFAELDLDIILQKLQGLGEWGQAEYEHILTLCPLSLKVFLEQFKRARKLDFASNMEQEFNLLQNFLHYSNFYEGIRAQIIDKDQQPRWHPESMDAISTTQLLNFFDNSLGKLKLL